MDIYNRVKIFESSSHRELEEQINTWFEENPILLVDVKFNHSMGYYRPTTYTAMIIYQDMGDEKEV